MIAPKDITQLETSGRSLELINRQLELLKNGVTSLTQLSGVTVDDGIVRLDQAAIDTAIHNYEQDNSARKWCKFVPASGAASRMFAYLHNFLEAAETSGQALNDFIQETQDVFEFIQGIKKFPFYPLVDRYIRENQMLKSEDEIHYATVFVKAMIKTEHFGYGSYPKGLLPFFTGSKGRVVTPFEAQLEESLALFQPGHPIEIHLTISKEHQAMYDAHEATFRKTISDENNARLTVNYSYQNILTDTPVLDEKDQWIRDENGNLFFRKGGHGALLDNLNQQSADLFWIKNIDNVLYGDANGDAIFWQKILAGYLIEVQRQLFTYLEDLEQGINPNLQLIVNFIRTHFDSQYIVLVSKEKPLKQKLIDYLDRPLRICAMIKNEGAPGGGPMWITSARGRSLQIVEGAELDSENPDHQKLMQESTHFNPVLMACAITNRQGEKYPLHDFSDQKRYMIVNKTVKGEKIKSLEWPGLWNGGMAFWNTIFVEVPNTTFHPVKKLNDLLKRA